MRLLIRKKLLNILAAQLAFFSLLALLLPATASAATASSTFVDSYAGEICRVQYPMANGKDTSAGDACFTSYHQAVYDAKQGNKTATSQSYCGKWAKSNTGACEAGWAKATEALSGLTEDQIKGCVSILGQFTPQSDFKTLTPQLNSCEASHSSSTPAGGGSGGGSSPAGGGSGGGSTPAGGGSGGGSSPADSGSTTQNLCKNTDCNDPAPTCSNNQCDLVGNYINPAINLLSLVFGLIAVASIIAGGIQYTTSSGDPQKAAQAKSRITNTIIAVVAYLFLYSFLQFLVPGGIFNR